MLQMRARGFALRDAFADVIAGLYIKEELEDMIPEEKEINPEPKEIKESRTDELTKILTENKAKDDMLKASVFEDAELNKSAIKEN